MKEMKNLLMITVALAAAGAVFVGVRHFMKKQETKQENVQIQTSANSQTYQNISQKIEISNQNNVSLANK